MKTSVFGSFTDSLKTAIFVSRCLLAELAGRRPKQLTARRKKEAQIDAGHLSKEVVDQLTFLQILTNLGYKAIKSTPELTNEDGMWCLQLVAIKEQIG